MHLNTSIHPHVNKGVLPLNPHIKDCILDEDASRMVHYYFHFTNQLIRTSPTLSRHQIYLSSFVKYHTKHSEFHL